MLVVYYLLNHLCVELFKRGLREKPLGGTSLAKTVALAKTLLRFNFRKTRKVHQSASFPGLFPE